MDNRERLVESGAGPQLSDLAADEGYDSRTRAAAGSLWCEVNAKIKIVERVTRKSSMHDQCERAAAEKQCVSNHSGPLSLILSAC